MNFLRGDRPVLDATRDDQKLTFFQPDLPVTEIHPESPLHDQEQLVLVFMMMPDKLTLEFDEFDVLAIQSPTILGLQWSWNWESFCWIFTFSISMPF